MEKMNAWAMINHVKAIEALREIHSVFTMTVSTEIISRDEVPNREYEMMKKLRKIENILSKYREDIVCKK